MGKQFLESQDMARELGISNVWELLPMPKIWKRFRVLRKMLTWARPSNMQKHHLRGGCAEKLKSKLGRDQKRRHERDCAFEVYLAWRFKKDSDWHRIRNIGWTYKRRSLLGRRGIRNWPERPWAPSHGAQRELVRGVFQLKDRDYQHSHLNDWPAVWFVPHFLLLIHTIHFCLSLIIIKNW